MNALDRIDLIAAAHTEYDRRRRAWIAVRDSATDHIDRARKVDAANADLLNWQDIVIYIEMGAIPADSRKMARSVRKTKDTMIESGRATNEQILQLCALTRAIEDHAYYRHKFYWDPNRQDWSDQPERKAA